MSARNKSTNSRDRSRSGQFDEVCDRNKPRRLALLVVRVNRNMSQCVTSVLFHVAFRESYFSYTEIAAVFKESRIDLSVQHERAYFARPVIYYDFADSAYRSGDVHLEPYMLFIIKQ